MTNSTLSSRSEQQVSQEAIAQRARSLWLERGQPAGQDEEIWLQAERELREQEVGATTPAVPVPAPSATPAVLSPSVSEARVETSPVKPAGRKRGGKGR
jgi:hypothetical protein